MYGYVLVASLMVIPIVIAMFTATKAEQSFEDLIEHDRLVVESLEKVHVAGHEMLGSAVEIALFQSLSDVDTSVEVMNEIQAFECAAGNFHRHITAYRNFMSEFFPAEIGAVKGVSVAGAKIIGLGNELIGSHAMRVSLSQLLKLKEDLKEAEKSFEREIMVVMERGHAELDLRKAAVRETVENAKTHVFIASCLILILSLVFGVAHATSIVGPIKRIQETALEIGAGNFVIPQDTERRDEVGELAKAVAKMSHDLQSMTNKMARTERLSTLGQVAGTISHELRNPLGTIRTSVFNLRERLGDGADVHERTLARIERNIVRCNKIVGSLLDFVRQRGLKCEVVKIDAWLAEALDELEVPAPVEMRRNLTSDAEVSIDQERLRRAVINVYDNACQAMLDDKAEAGSEKELVLTVSSRLAGERVEIEFQDSGTGIDDAGLEKMFEPLYSTKSFGVGLGLPTVQQIMEQHGGGVDIASVQGEGMRVVLWLAMDKDA